MTRRYKAFISYSWADRAWGEWLHRTLETYRAPKGVADGQSLHPIFKDREEEAAGGSVGAAIEAALAASENLIVICSPRSAKSAWVNREIAWFKTRKDKARIFALIVDGEPGASGIAGREAEECFPKTLTHKVAGDLQPTEEWEDAPLAADARAEGDGRRGAKLKLAAALLGVGLDDLVRRDERRRTIRRRFVTSAAFGLATVLGGLSIFAFNQRDAAVVARNEAVKARDDAEGLIELILTDLKSDLEGFGTLKSVTQIGNRAIGYYEGQDVKALSPDQLGRRARVLLMLGEADNKRGDLSAALARYETAAATTKEQLARDPENPQRMFDHAQSVFWVGYIAWQRGDRTTAKRQFSEYHDLAQALVAKDPANEDWQAELDYAYSNLGTLAMDDGEAAEAEGYFRKSLEIALARLDRAPDNAEHVQAAGQAYAWLADSLYAQVRLNDAISARQREAELYADASAKHPQDQRFKLAFVKTLATQSRLLTASGEVDDAINLSKEAARLADEALASDPQSTDNIYTASLAHAYVGEALVYKGNHGEAADFLAKALQLGRQLVGTDERVVLWRAKLLAHPLLFVARCDISKGRPDLALQKYEEALTVLGSDAVAIKADPISVQRYVSAIAGKARLSTDSRSDWTGLVELLRPKSDRIGPELQLIYMEGLLKTGEAGAAQRVAEGLTSAGYRHPDFTAMRSTLAEAAPNGRSTKP